MKYLKKQFNFNPKKIQIAVAILVFAVISTVLLYRSEASTPIHAGAQFHCTWSSYTDEERIAALDRLAESGVEWVRIDLGWSSFETREDYYSQWYIDRTNFCVDQANSRGLKVLGMVHRTPSWANGGLGTSEPPEDLADYADFMSWIADKYRGRVSAWQIWNEPDPSQNFWGGTTEQYVDMMKLAYPSIKQSDPNVKVVLGGPSLNNFEFIRDVYEYGGKNSFDVLSTHPYQAIADKEPEYDPDDGTRYWLSSFKYVHDVMVEFDDGDKEVWFTEFGWSSHENTGDESNGTRGVTEAEQADYAVRAFEYVEDNFPNVTTMFWYTTRNRGDSNDHINNYGLLYEDLTPKPVIEKLQSFLTNNDDDSDDDSDSSTKDTEAPSTPVNLTAEKKGRNTSISWDESTDNVGVVGYYVFRDGSKIATVDKTEHKDKDGKNSSEYTVVAFDAANNQSPASEPISVSDDDKKSRGNSPHR